MLVVFSVFIKQHACSQAKSSYFTFRKKEKKQETFTRYINLATGNWLLLLQDIFVKVFFFFLFTPQWLVKKAIERKEEMGDYIREFSVSQFSKYHTTPQVNAKCLSWVLNSWRPHLSELWDENNRALWACAGGAPSQNCAQTHTSEPAWKLGASSLWGFPSRNGKGSHSRVASTVVQFPLGWPCLMLMWDPLTPCTLDPKRRVCLHALWNATC